MKYSDQLKDPRWQKRRLDILNRDNFTCQMCGHTEKTLHVHHIHYYQGMLPWEYADGLLVTLCEECHECEHSTKKHNETNWTHHLMLTEINKILSEYLVSSWYVSNRKKLLDDTLLFLKGYQKNDG